jgi:hypothetical protein
MAVSVWQDLMEHHYPNSAWISVARDSFDRLWSFKRKAGLETWEQVFDRLLPDSEDR